jgi:hypothetical protein
MRHPKSRLVAAAAVTGTVCALAAAGAASASTVWSKSAPAIPHSYTNATPGLATFFQNSVHGTFVVWKGQLSSDVYYRYKVNGKWSPVRAIPGAHTNSSPSAAYYVNAQSKASEFVAWKALKSNTIYYATGLIGSGRNSALSWTSGRSIALKTDKLAYSDTGPSVLFPLNSPNGRVIISWRGPGHHVRYELGTESGKNKRLFNFDKSNWISGNTATVNTQTSGAPSLAEQIAPNGNGLVYVFWKADGAGKAISYASTPDLAGTGLTGSKSVHWTLLGGVPGAVSTSGPAASDQVPTHAAYAPLMVAYKGPTGDFIRYQILTISGGVTSWTKYAFVTGKDNKTAIGPALLGNLLVNDSPTSNGLMYQHGYTG